MSDFDAVLERLLSDEVFAASLAEDPDRALGGYQLDPDEIALLRSQVSPDDSGGATSAVEGRTTKSSTFGLFSALGDWSEFGSAAGSAARAAGDAIGPSGGAGGSMIPAHSALGDAPSPDLDEMPAVARMGDAPDHGLGDATTLAHAEPLHRSDGDLEGVGASRSKHEGVGDYKNKVDVNGDGKWDKATYAAREDGGVDIMVDRDNDGKVDFVGRDFDRDWKVDEATIDKDTDGVFEKTMYDDNNDGWLDRTVWHND